MEASDIAARRSSRPGERGRLSRRPILAARLARTRGHGDALDGHALLTRLKVAVALGLLDERYSVTEEDWDLAEIIMIASDATRAAVQDQLRRSAAKVNEARAHVEAARAVIVGGAVENDRVKRIARLITRKLADAGNPGMMRSELRRALSHRDRPDFEGALDRLVEAGQVKVDDFDIGVRYRIAADSR